ncbi:efflux RND transporter periplasmic adaptor subunit [Clostridia bacterium]|nr:efflux RND transporter periplasmic adaptor subunit [Clostridia bacterium]
MKKWIIIGTILLLGTGIIGCSRQTANLEEQPSYKTVGVVEIKNRLEDDTLSYTGIVKPSVEKKLSFKMGGYLEQIYVQEGDYVEAGTKLGRIDTKDNSLQSESLESQSQIAQKEALKASEALSYSKTQYDSYTALFEEGAVSKVALDAKELAYEQAKLNYEIALENRSRMTSEETRLYENIADGTIYADQDGVINSILYEVSEFIAPGQPVFLVGSKEQKIVIHVTREDKKLLEIGQKVYYTMDTVEKEGRIIFVDEVPDAQTSTYKVEIEIEEKELMSGAIVRVEVVAGSTEGIWIPIQCIQSTTIDFVYVIQDGKSLKRSINVLEIKGDEAWVEGLEENDKLVVSGMKSLVEGMLVKTQEFEG